MHFSTGAAASSTVLLMVVVGICYGQSHATLATSAYCGCSNYEYFLPSASLQLPANWNVYGRNFTTAEKLCAQDNGVVADSDADFSCLREYVAYLFAFYNVLDSERIWVTGKTTGPSLCNSLQQCLVLPFTCSTNIRFICQRKVSGILPVPPFIANSDVTQPNPGLYPNTAVTYTCRPGYEMLGSSPFTSQCSGWNYWSVPPQTCNAINCSSLSTPTNGQMALSSGFQFGSKASFTCSSGYVLAGNLVISCQADKSWSGPIPACNPVNCGTPKPVANSSLAYNGITFGSTAQYTCHTGHRGLLEGRTAFSAECQATAVWNTTTVSCSAVDCGRPPSLPNSNMTYTTTEYLSTAVYYCTIGHENSTPLMTATCQSTAIWDVGNIQCKPVRCPALLPPTNGKTVFTNGTAYRGVAMFACDTGFLMFENGLLQCRSDKLWNGTVPICIPVNCSMPPSLANVKAAYNMTTYLSTVTYTCIAGYTSSASQMTANCQSTALWDVQNIECTAINCRQPPSYPNTAVQYIADTYLAKAVYTCMAGYEPMSPLPQSVCQADGEWQMVNISCQVVQCPSLLPPTNGRTIFTNGTAYHSVAIFACDVGYELTGNGLVQCRSDKSWNSTVPQCNAINCGKPPSLPSNNVVFTNTTYGATATYTCIAGHTNSTAQMTATCQATALWSIDSILCRPVDCGRVPNYPNSAIDRDGPTTYPTTIVYKCLDGYEPQQASSNMSVSCLATGRWSQAAISCTVVRCPALLPPTNGKTVFTNGTAYRGVAMFACDTGYLMFGNGLLQCRSDKLWNGTVPICIPINCGKPPSRPSNNVVFTNTTYGATATYTCIAGHTNSMAQMTATCQATGLWSVDSILCRPVDCGRVPNYPNSAVDRDGPTTYPTTIVYKCLDGYEPQQASSNMSMSCLATGHWSQAAISCTAVVCPPLEAPANGKSIFSNGSAYRGIVKFACDPGFDLSGSTVLQCLSDTSWNGTMPRCLALSNCSAVQRPENGDISLLLGSHANEPNTVVLFTCRHGYKLNGSSAIRCTVEGKWSDGRPSCQGLESVQPTAVVPQQSASTWDGEKTGLVVVSVVVPCLIIMLIAIREVRLHKNRTHDMVELRGTLQNTERLKEESRYDDHPPADMRFHTESSLQAQLVTRP